MKSVGYSLLLLFALIASGVPNFAGIADYGQLVLCEEVQRDNAEDSNNFEDTEKFTLSHTPEWAPSTIQLFAPARMHATHLLVYITTAIRAPPSY